MLAHLGPDMNLFFEMLKEVNDNVLCECVRAFAFLRSKIVSVYITALHVEMQVPLEKRLDMLKEKQGPKVTQFVGT